VSYGVVFLLCVGGVRGQNFGLRRVFFTVIQARFGAQLTLWLGVFWVLGFWRSLGYNVGLKRAFCECLGVFLGFD